MHYKFLCRKFNFYCENVKSIHKNLSCILIVRLTKKILVFIDKLRMLVESKVKNYNGRHRSRAKLGNVPSAIKTQFNEQNS